jgi:hypothetical protein
MTAFARTAANRRAQKQREREMSETPMTKNEKPKQRTPKVALATLLCLMKGIMNFDVEEMRECNVGYTRPNLELKRPVKCLSYIFIICSLIRHSPSFVLGALGGYCR